MPITEQDEFLLSQLLDGDLDAGQADALRARIAREPDLGSTFESLQRLNGLLLTQQVRQPEVDYAGLRSEIMDAVHAARRPSIIRFPLWRVAAGAVAAAAAIALVLMVYWPGGPSDPVPQSPYVHHTPEPVVVPQDVKPEPTPSRTLLVQFNRPRSSAPQQPALKVNYVRSDELAGEMTARDKERRSRPTWHMYVAQRERKSAAPSSPFDLPL